ncbi:MAG: DUF1858 domain-containing protein [Vallitaleaceae bacterium]|jgi:hypothetical protein|nr:DUF1858 domain-containing protein [Vallitaleaceae bacterium]
MKTISRKETVYNVIKEHPEIKEIMAELGFKDILKPGMLQSVGKIMTIEKGARMKSVSMEQIIEAFEVKGIKLI